MKYLKGLLLGVCVLGSGVLSFSGSMHVWGQPMEAVGQAEQQVLVTEVVTPFLEALQTGDALALEQLIGGKLAVTLGPLLRENTEYPNFLRQRYGGTTISAPIQIVQDEAASSPALASEGGQRLAVVHLQTSEGQADHFQLTLEQDLQGAWKITDKIMQR